MLVEARIGLDAEPGASGQPVAAIGIAHFRVEQRERAVEHRMLPLVLPQMRQRRRDLEAGGEEDAGADRGVRRHLRAMLGRQRGDPAELGDAGVRHLGLDERQPGIHQPVALRRYLCVLALFTLGNSSNMFLLLRARELGLGDAQVPLIWALVCGVAAVFGPPLSAWSDRIDRRRLIVGGWAVYALFYLVFGLLPATPLLLWPLFAGYGLFLAATEGAEKALVADLVPGEQAGTAFGWYNLVAGVLLLPASLLFGWLWSDIAPLAAFAFGSACALAAALLLAFWVRPAAAV